MNERAPESLEGWWILHRMFVCDRRAWDAVGEKRRSKVASHASDLFEHLQSGKDGDAALAQIVGDKGNVMLTHYARSFEGLAYAQTLVDKLEVREYLMPQWSYTSVLELLPESADEAESSNFGARLWAKIPKRRYVCFYATNKRREGDGNWRKIPGAYRTKVTQVISGSLGIDDYEWAVDLYADDPVVFKKLLAEARFEPEARNDEFGPFFTGVQFSSRELRVFLDGDAVPALDGTP